MDTKKNFFRSPGCLGLAALALAISGTTTRPAYAQAQDPQQAISENEGARTDVEKTGEKHTLFAALTESGPAVAAKTPAARTSPTTGSSFSWTGFYIGGHVGNGWGNGDTSLNPLPTAAQFINLAPQTLHPRPRGPIGGIQGGYNWQFHPHFVLGIEGDFSWSDIDGTVKIIPITQNNGTPFPGAGFVQAQQEIQRLGTVRGRLGFAPVSRMLVYGTGGFAYGHVIYLGETNFRPVGTTDYLSSFNKNKSGWIGGMGVEVAACRRWSVKGEYLYTNLGSENSVVNANPLLPPFQVGYHFESHAHILSLGVNFRF